MTSHHAPRRRMFAVTIEMAYSAEVGRPVTRVLHVEAPTAEAAAEKVGRLAGIGAGDFIDSIRPL